MSWQRILVHKSELQLQQTLLGGQSFRWKFLEDEQVYAGVFSNILWHLKQDKDELCYKIVGEVEHYNSKIRLKIDPVRKNVKGGKLLYPDSYYEKLLRSYFRLDVDLMELYKTWQGAHKHFNSVSEEFFAVRMLNQDPVENTISFICSQNNHISRISTMVEKICKLFGEQIVDEYYTFPSLEKLADSEVEAVLREEKFGYRAKYITKAAQQILDKGYLDWYESLMGMKYKEAQSELVQIYGIGAKVADCICLMSLNHLEAIPVDTHIFNLGKQYLPHLNKAKTVTPKIYDEVADYFRKVYGDYAGWAQTILFCSELRSFKKN